MSNEPESVQRKEPLQCWPSQNIHCDQSHALHNKLAQATATVEAMQGALREIAVLSGRKSAHIPEVQCLNRIERLAQALLAQPQPASSPTKEVPS